MVRKYRQKRGRKEELRMFAEFIIPFWIKPDPSNLIIRLLSQELDIHARGSSIIYLHRFPVYLSNGKNPTRCHQVPSRSYGTYLLAGANPGSTEWRAEQWGEYTEIE